MTDALLADLRALAEEGTDPSGEPLPEWVHVDELRDLIAKHTPEPDVSERDELAQVIARAVYDMQGGAPEGPPPILLAGDRRIADAILAAGWRRR